jgi:hypothetical protein
MVLGDGVIDLAAGGCSSEQAGETEHGTTCVVLHMRLAICPLYDKGQRTKDR